MCANLLCFDLASPLSACLRSLSLQHEPRQSEPIRIQGLIVEHFMCLKDRGSLSLIINRGLSGDLRDPHVVPPGIKLWMEIGHQKGPFVVAGMIVGEGIRRNAGLQIDIEHSPTVDRVSPFWPSLNDCHAAQFPGVHRIPVPPATPGRFGGSDRTRHQDYLLPEILPFIRVDIASKA